MVCSEAVSVQGEDNKGVGNDNSENKSKIKNNKDTDNSITEEVVGTFEATQGKTGLEDKKKLTALKLPKQKQPTTVK